MRVFYVIYLTDALQENCLNAIRLLCNPCASLPAHITVRGPYRRQQALPAVQRLVKDQVARVRGVGRFEGERQTVYLKCHSNTFRRVWHKPDYGFTPHLTLYNGSSRAFADSLFELLSGFAFDLNFKIRCLEPVFSQSGQRRFDLAWSFDTELVSRLASRRIDVSDIELLGDGERLNLIGKVCQLLVEKSSSATAPTGRRAIA